MIMMCKLAIVTARPFKMPQVAKAGAVAVMVVTERLNGSC